MTPEQGHFLVQSVYLPLYAREHQLTKAVIAAIPEQKADHRHDSIGRTALDLAWHIAVAENRFIDAVWSGSFKFENASRPESVQTPAQILGWYVEHFDSNIEHLKESPGETLVAPLDFRGLFKLPAVLFLQTGIGHSIHHRGQLSTYLRPMGAKVPSIYGESYDAREARERAAKPS